MKLLVQSLLWLLMLLGGVILAGTLKRMIERHNLSGRSK